MSVIALFKESGVYIFFKFLLLPNDVMFYCYLMTYMFYCYLMTYMFYCYLMT